MIKKWKWSSTRPRPRCFVFSSTQTRSGNNKLISISRSIVYLSIFIYILYTQFLHPPASSVSIVQTESNFDSSVMRNTVQHLAAQAQDCAFATKSKNKSHLPSNQLWFSQLLQCFNSNNSDFLGSAKPTHWIKLYQIHGWTIGSTSPRRWRGVQPRWSLSIQGDNRNKTNVLTSPQPGDLVTAKPSDWLNFALIAAKNGPDVQELKRHWNVSFVPKLACANFNAADKLDGRGISLGKQIFQHQIWAHHELEQTLKLENNWKTNTLWKQFCLLANSWTIAGPFPDSPLRQRGASRRTPDISVKAKRWRWRKQSPHHFWALEALALTVSQKQASHGYKLIDLTQPLPCALGTVESQVSMVWFCFLKDIKKQMVRSQECLAWSSENVLCVA